MTTYRDVAVYMPVARATSIVRCNRVSAETLGGLRVVVCWMEDGSVLALDPRALVKREADTLYSPRTTPLPDDADHRVFNEWLAAHPEWPDATDLRSFRHIPWGELRSRSTKFR